MPFKYKIYMNKKILFLILLSVVALPTVALADITIKGIVDASVNIALYVASGVVVILWIMTGVIFLTAQGDPAKLKSGKTALIAAVAGTIIIIIASSAINFVGNAFNT